MSVILIALQVIFWSLLGISFLADTDTVLWRVGALGVFVLLCAIIGSV